MNANIGFPRGANLRRLCTALFVAFVFVARASAAWIWIDGHYETQVVPGHWETVTVAGYYEIVLHEVVICYSDGTSATEWVEVTVWVEPVSYTVWIDGYWEEIWVDGYWEWDGNGEPQP